MIIISSGVEEKSSFADFLGALSEELGIPPGKENPNHLNDAIICSARENSPRDLRRIIDENLNPAAVLMFSPYYLRETFRDFYKITFPVLIVVNKNMKEELRNGWIYHDNISDSKLENVSGDEEPIWVSRRAQCISLTKKFLSNGFKNI